MQDAQFLFNRLAYADEYAWTSLIHSHVEYGEYNDALHLFHSMEGTLVQPSKYTFVAVLKACAHLKALEIGLCIHLRIVKMGYDIDSYIGNTLLNMYSINNTLLETKKLFELLPKKVAVSWNILIAGYRDFGLTDKALECLNEMQSQNVLPNEVTFLEGLQACCSFRAVSKGRGLHSEAIKLGADEDLSVGTTLVNMYSKFGLPVEAQTVIHHLRTSSVVCWNALITGYVESFSVQEALKCLDQMQHYGVAPNSVTFIYGIKACTVSQDLIGGQILHSEIIVTGFDHLPDVGNSLVDFYAKCGTMLETCDVFDKLPKRSVVSWSSLIRGYVENCVNDDALKCFGKMNSEGLFPDAATYVCVLQACEGLESQNIGRDVHVMIVKVGHEKNLYVSNMLLNMYMKGGHLADGRGIFNSLQYQNLISWNTLITGYVEHGLDSECLLLYEQLRLEGLIPDVTTFIPVLKACGFQKNTLIGQQLHAFIVCMGFESDTFLGNSIVDMYSKCGSLVEAHYVFALLLTQTRVSWNSIITGFSEYGLSEDVLRLAREMNDACFSSDITTYVCIIKACRSLKLIVDGQKYHKEIIVKGLEGHLYVGSALVDMYANCGLPVEAQMVLNGLPGRNVVTWTSLITGYMELGLDLDALECFGRMLADHISPSIITYASILRVYSNLLVLSKGEEVYSRIIKEGLLSSCEGCLGKCENKLPCRQSQAGELEDAEFFVMNSLIDMYCKCGNMLDAHNVFGRMDAVDPVTWNALLIGYARQGNTENVLHIFNEVQETSEYLNEVMFLAVLTVCSHDGLIILGKECFQMMIKEYCFFPTLEHLNCLTDLFSRAGQLEAAVAILESMPYEPDLVTWSTLLGASRIFADVHLGKQSFEWVARLDRGNAAAFIVMSNIYAEADMWEDAERIDSERHMLDVSHY
ncbi:hypothetical protein KP509_09G023800 [Ceratopteris richardii]|nr:hypothetical protein KP509_09G023800 [Ceratopteris richardii]